MTKDFWHYAKIPKILEKEYNNFKNYYILYFIFYLNYFLIFNIFFYNINDNYPDDSYPTYNFLSPSLDYIFFLKENKISNKIQGG